MEQINCFAFYDLGNLLQDVYLRSRRGPINALEYSATKAMQMLSGMAYGGTGFRFDVSQDAAIELVAVLGEWVLEAKENPERALDSSSPDLEELDRAIGNFNQALSLEMGRAPVFLVLPKGVYDTRLLITNAAAMYDGYHDRLPKEAIDDTNAAGRCLAFDLPTAAGFHIARATEAVIKKYMEVYRCPSLKESQRNWGRYTDALAKAGAHPVIIHHIDQLRELHRNPVTHPDTTLTRSDAIALLAMCQSVIQSMVADMETKVASPDAAIVELLPASGTGAVNIPAVNLGWGQPDELPAPSSGPTS